MKKGTLLIFLILLSFNYLYAQQEKIVLKAGASLHDFKMEQVYKYPAFVNSKVIYKDNVTSVAKLNYNQLTEKMEFINPKGDTLVIIGKIDIKTIILDKSAFYFDKGYFELIKETPSISLARKVSLNMADKEKIGAFGMPSSTTAIDTYEGMANGLTYAKLKPNINYVFSKTTRYYLTHNKINFIPATQKNLLKMVESHKEALKGYFKTTDVDFNKKESIEAVINYLESLKN